MKLSVVAALGLASALVALGALATEAVVVPKQIAGIYSDLAYNEESGDLNGTEIFIVPGGNGTRYFAFVQEAEGGPGDPVVTPVLRKGDQVFIRAHFPDFTEEFDGKIGASAFEGRLTIVSPNGKKISEHFRLQHKKSYWQ